MIRGYKIIIINPSRSCFIWCTRHSHFRTWIRRRCNHKGRRAGRHKQLLHTLINHGLNLRGGRKDSFNICCISSLWFALMGNIWIRWVHVWRRRKLSLEVLLLKRSFVLIIWPIWASRTVILSMTLFFAMIADIWNTKRNRTPSYLRSCMCW